MGPIHGRVEGEEHSRAPFESHRPTTHPGLGPIHPTTQRPFSAHYSRFPARHHTKYPSHMPTLDDLATAASVVVLAFMVALSILLLYGFLP